MRLGKPVKGIDQLSDETSLLADERGTILAIREGLNIDLDKEGNASRRQGFTQKLAGDGYHSLYKSKRGWLMLCHKDELGVYGPTANSFTVLANMGEASLTSFAEANGNLYAVNKGFSGMIRVDSSTVIPLGVPLPALTPSFAAIANGTLQPGTYAITYTYVDAEGEESGTGPFSYVELPTGGGIQGTMFTSNAGTYRVYMTKADGEELYQAAEFMATSYAIVSHQEGRTCDTNGLEPLPYGYIIREHHGRLYVATTGFVYYSEAFRPHLYNPAYNFIPTTGFTTMLQPVDTGIFIGDSLGVRFYPDNGEVKDVSTEAVVFGSALTIPGEYLPSSIGTNDLVAMWFTASGYQIGLPSGELVRLNAQQINLPRYAQGCAVLAVRDGRKQVITAVDSSSLTGTGIALDSVGYGK